jgi:hypothetical protein
MNSQVRIVIGLAALVTIVGCGGGATTDPAASRPPTQVEDLGPPGEALLVCTAISVAPQIGTLSWMVPGARTSDASPLPSLAARMLYARATAVSQSERSSADPRRRSLQSSTSGRNEEGELLKEYASLWAVLLTTPDSAAEAEARIAEIDEMNPGVMESYVGVVLYASRAWDLGCDTPGY